MDRRRFLLFPLAGIPVAGYARFVEPTWLELTRERIVIPGLRTDRPIRIVQISDLHASDVVPQSLIEQAVDLGLAQKPDLLLLTGDYITEGKDFDLEWYRKTLSRIPAQVPCYATLGNHDGGAWSSTFGTLPYSTLGVKKLIASAGIPLLFNASVEVPVRGQTVRVVGLGDLWAGDCDPSAAFRGVPSDKTLTIVMSHNPDSKDMMGNYPWHIMLSGHTHGGQVVVPVLGISPAPVHDRRYIKGLKPWNDRLIYVNAGVGNIEGVRFNCRPQVSLLEFHGV